MSADISKIVVLLFGIVVCMFSLWSMFSTAKLRQLISAITYRVWGYYFAAAVRLGLGLALISAAPESRYPALFQIVGWLALAAAVGLLIMGKDRLSKFVEWFDRFSDAAFRAWLVLGVSFGVFLIYGAA